MSVSHPLQTGAIAGKSRNYMATRTDCDVHILADASKARAWLAIIVPLAFPFIIAIALSKSDHAISDYFSLIGSGELSAFRQAIMWLAMVTFVAVYVPPAIAALTRDRFLASTPTEFITPSGERIDLAKVQAIAVRKTFWHRIVVVQEAGLTRAVTVTFARPPLDGIRQALRSDYNLRKIAIS